MADKELASITAATTPLAGTELVYLVQGGNSRKATVADVRVQGADEVPYDNAGSGLSATDVQAAIDEVVTLVGTPSAADVSFDPSGLSNTDATDLQEAIEDLDAAIGGVAGAVGKQTIWVPASAMALATTSPPAAAQIETSSNKVNIPVLDFDASADEIAHFNIAFPKGWNEGTITFRVKWCSSATDTDGVAWALEGVAISDNEALDASWGTAVVVTDDAQSAANELYVTAESSALTIAGTPAVGDLCFFRIYRDVSDGNDDMTEDARLIGVEIFYTTDAANDA